MSVLSQRRSSVLGRVGLTVLDQSVSSMTTLGVLLVVARATDAGGFGAIAIGLSIVVVVTGLARAFGTDPLLVHHSSGGGGKPVSDLHEADTGQPSWSAAVSASTGTSLAVGASAAVLVGLAGVSTVSVNVELAHVLWAVASLLPFLCLADAWRFVSFAASRPQLAIAIDATWVVIFAVLTVGGGWFAGDRPSSNGQAWQLMYLWGAGAVVASGVGIVLLGLSPRVSEASSWCRRHVALSRRCAIEFAMVAGATQIAMWSVGAFRGLGEAGGMRTAALVLGPVGVLANGVIAAVVPESARSGGRPGGLTSMLAWPPAALMVGWGVLVRLLPADIGTVLLRDRWLDAREIFVPLSVLNAGLIVAVVSSGALRGAGRSPESVRIITSLTLVSVLVGVIASPFGAPITCLAMSIPAWVGALVAHRRAGAPRPQPAFLGGIS